MLNRKLLSACISLSMVIFSIGNANGGETDAQSHRVVAGTIQFQQRYTRVVGAECVTEPCMQSQGYWSVVLQSGNDQYLINKKLEVGRARAPEIVVIAGVRVKPGSMVEIEGEVLPYGQQMYTIQNLVRVRPINDLGWVCYHVGGDGTKTHARVWHDPLNSSDLDEMDQSLNARKMIYHLRVQKMIDRTIRPIAFINDTTYVFRGTKWTFSGMSEVPFSSEVELQINEKSSNFNSVSARLKIVDNSGQARRVGQESLSAVTVLDMNCSRTRTFDIDDQL